MDTKEKCDIARTVAEKELSVDIRYRVRHESECEKQRICNKFIRELANDYIHFKIFGKKRSDVTALSKQNKSFKKIAKTLRKTSSHMENRNAEFFETVLTDTNPNTAEASFNSISEVVLCPEQLNWGRIISLFVYGGILAEAFWKSQQEEKISEVEDWLAMNISAREKWIDQKGGWEDFSNTFSYENYEDRPEIAHSWMAPVALLVGAAIGIALNRFVL